MAEYCDERVCLCVCVFVCPRSYLRNGTSDFHQIYMPVTLWPWLGSPLARVVIRYVLPVYG